MKAIRLALYRPLGIMEYRNDGIMVKKAWRLIEATFFTSHGKLLKILQAKI